MQTWQVEVTLISRAPLAEEHRDRITTALSGPVIIADDNRNGTMSITFRVRAESRDRAVFEASSALTDAARQTLGDILPFLGISAGRDGGTASELAPSLVGYIEISTLLGVSRQRARELAEKHGLFPAPVARLATGPVFTLESVQEFLSKWERKGGRPPKKRVS
ncbi:hypothetical protein [Sinosporangium album]|uniref:hypothetical protein n=1 Tax=Sinosporangium album TaxID=504805 RepID=UPI00115FCCB9|nr:hypothetical protein [Sinosporangium album]